MVRALLKLFGRFGIAEHSQRLDLALSPSEGSGFAIMTSVDLIMASTLSPLCSPRSSTASLDIIEVSLTGEVHAILINEVMSPLSISVTLAATRFLALSL